MNLLSLRDVAKFYGRKPVLRHLSLDVAPGEVLLVAGANGAGKSTLLKIMAGLSRPSAGRVRLEAPARRTAYLGHATFLYPGLTALGNLAFWAGMYGLQAEPGRLLAALERVGLDRVANERVAGFSRGMAQRLNLARVFLVTPLMVFLDEPGTGLDSPSLGLLRREITGFRDRGAAVVWVSHHLAEDALLADRVLVLDQGRAAYAGPAADYARGTGSC